MQSLSNQGRAVTLEQMYGYAHDNGIGVYGFRLPNSRAVTLRDQSGNCIIGIDNSRRYSRAEQKTILAHELGHCATGAFYDLNLPVQTVEKYERKAENWAILNIMPYEAVIEAYRDGVRNLCELAEYFEVSEQLAARAVAYYLEEGKGVGI